VLGVEIDGPLTVTVSPGVSLRAEMLVKGFGARRGTLVFQKFPGLSGALPGQGFTASSFGPYADGVECSLGQMVEVLGDWGWCGDGAAPPWLLTIDGAGWSQPADFHAALLPRLGAKSWHGHMLDALRDASTACGINGAERPFAVRVFNTATFSPDMKAFMVRVETVFVDARKRGIPVELWVCP
jgi:hypothetical protein